MKEKKKIFLIEQFTLTKRSFSCKQKKRERKKMVNAVVLNLFCSVAHDQCVIISMALHRCFSTSQIEILLVLYMQNTHKIQYNLNSVFKLFHGSQKVFHGPQEQIEIRQNRMFCDSNKRRKMHFFFFFFFEVRFKKIERQNRIFEMKCE